MTEQQILLISQKVANELKANEDLIFNELGKCIGSSDNEISTNDLVKMINKSIEISTQCSVQIVLEILVQNGLLTFENERTLTKSSLKLI